MTRQKLMELVGDESPSYERIRFVCCTPQEDGNVWLQLPRTYDLEDPLAYFCTDIRVRHENLLTRSNWAMAFASRSGPAPKRAKVGNQKSGGEGAGSGGEDARQQPAQTRLLGRPLSRAENGRALDHRPKSPGGRFICWDSAAHQGCAREACPHSHKQIGKPQMLDRMVQMQMVRRGGLKTGPKVKSAEEAEKKIEALRQAHQKEEASKRTPPTGPKA